MPNATVRANVPASPKSAKPAPEAEPAKHPRIIAAEIVAGFELEKKIKQIQSEGAVEKAEEASKKRKEAASQRFENAHYNWLSAKTDKQEPEQEDQQQRDSCELEARDRARLFHDSGSLSGPCLGQVRGIRASPKSRIDDWT
jgi:hypothetical protein